MHFPQLLTLRGTRQSFSTMLGDILNREITNKKHRNVENVALTRLWKGHVYSLRAEARRQGVAC